MLYFLGATFTCTHTSSVFIACLHLAETESSSFSVQSKSGSLTPHFVQYVEGSSGKYFNFQQLMKLICKQFFRTFCCQVQGASITNSHEFLGIFQLLHFGPRDAFAQNHSRDIPHRFIHSFILVLTFARTIAQHLI
ncbi:unnamed protein product [Ixodes pacificus]